MYDNIMFSVESDKHYSNNELNYYLSEIKKAFGNLAKIIV